MPEEVLTKLLQMQFVVCALRSRLYLRTLPTNDPIIDFFSSRVAIYPIFIIGYLEKVLHFPFYFLDGVYMF
jgi:hypothetical protein